MVTIAGDGVNSVRTRQPNIAPPPPPPPPPVIQRPVDAGRAKAATENVAAQAATKTLAETAASAPPVAAGKALNQLDRQNGGNRFVTDQQVSFASMKTQFMGATALTAAPTKTVIDTDEGGDFNRTIIKGTSSSSSLYEGNSEKTLTEKTKITYGIDGASISKTTTDQTTSKIFDNLGRGVNPETGQPTTMVERKVESSVSAKVDKDAATVTMSVKGEKNGLTSGYTSTTKLDDNGLSQSKSVELGQAKATATGGLKIDEKGAVTTSATGAINLGPVGAKVKAEQVTGPDSTKTSTTTNFTVKTPDGKPVSASVDYKLLNSEELSTNKDGTTTYKLTGETKLTVAAGVDIKKISVDGSWFNGERTVHTVTVPKGVDPKTINPADPKSWPNGTRVMIKSEDFKGSSLGAAYANFGIEGSAETRDGTSIVMEKKDSGNLAIATGPTLGFTNSGKLKVDVVAGFGAEVGASNKVDFAFYKTFNIDLNAPGGADSFTNVYTGRQAPADNGNGVSNLMDTTYGDWNYTASAKLNTPFGSFGPERQEGSKSVWKTYPDGKVEYSRTYDANGDGKGELTKTATSTDGKTWKDEVYTFTLEVTTDKNSQLHNAQQMTANDNLKVGDKIEIKLTANEIQALRQKEQSFASWGSESADVKVRMNDSFADYIGRQNGIDGILPKLFTLKHSNKVGDYTSELPKVDLDHPLPGDVTIIVK